MGSKDGLAINLANRALMMQTLGNLKEALPLAEEAYRLATQHGLTALANHIEPILDSIRSRLS